MGFEDVSVVTGRSNVQIPYISLAGDSWAEYKDFIGEVRIDGALRNTTVSTDDIAYFAPQAARLAYRFQQRQCRGRGCGRRFHGQGQKHADRRGYVAHRPTLRSGGFPTSAQTRFDLNDSAAHILRRSRRRTGCGDRRPRVVRQAGRRYSGNTGQIDVNARFKRAAFVVRHAARRLDRRGRASTCNLRMTPLARRGAAACGATWRRTTCVWASCSAAATCWATRPSRPISTEWSAKAIPTPTSWATSRSWASTTISTTRCGSTAACATASSTAASRPAIPTSISIFRGWWISTTRFRATTSRWTCAMPTSPGSISTAATPSRSSRRVSRPMPADARWTT